MTFNFNDIFKSSFTETISTFSATDTLIALGLSLVIGLFILFIYKKNVSGRSLLRRVWHIFSGNYFGYHLDHFGDFVQCHLVFGYGWRPVDRALSYSG